ncbi:MAG: hypothetical protein UZ13_01277 [Chloroflexi bacterium OLB13]|nr:MAG: hypothetical protein UZ13_01277 [Chloroflexi bacterium OLB13]
MTKRLILAAVLVLSTLAGAFGVASAQDTPAVGEYAGVVESFDGTTLMVSGLTFQADTADIDDSVTMQVGELVEVKFVASAGALTAYNVDDVEVGDDAIATVGEITGSLEMVDAASAVIAGLTFDISHARVDDDVVLVSGTLVEIDFIYNASLFGFRISAGDPEDLNDPFDDMDDDDETASITGAIEALDATSMTVAGLVFNIATAHIDDDGTLAVGVVVEVEYVVESDGSLRALDVDFKDDDDADDSDDDDSDDDDAYGDDDHISGVVQSISGTMIVVEGMTFDISRASIDDDGTLAVGTFVEIEYVTLSDGSLLALEVEFEDDDLDEDDDATTKTTRTMTTRTMTTAPTARARPIGRPIASIVATR